MATIGVYDSGIGGLTTAKIILDKFAGNDLYYLADNYHHPFGNTDEGTLKQVVANGVKHLRAHSDVVVLACNTASSITDDKDVIKLLPPLDEFRNDEKSTLVMATARTISTLHPASGFNIADVRELATLVEIQAGLQCVKNSLDMSELIPYLQSRIAEYKGVKNVILGCSHYLYAKKQLIEILGDVKFADGNAKLCQELSKHVSHNPEKAAKITFDFTLTDESKKYGRILRLLMNSAS